MIVKSVRGIEYDLIDALKRNPVTIQAGDNISKIAVDEIERLQKLCDMWVPTTKVQSGQVNSKEGLNESEG